jgi:hypothetical protein
MDRGTWIALGVMVFATLGVAVLLLMPQSDSTTTAPLTVAPAPASQTPTAQNCQTIAEAAATQDQASSGNTTSVIETYFSQADQKCYYEVNIFSSAGNIAAIKLAPNDQNVASCTTSSTNTLSCQKADGSTITEPQFKALLTTYLGN